ncbi:MAG: carboxymuconolactone decarboxylase family protein [Flavobacteriales bacterium]|nr:carboxymuconolactone decarboxylase family protein [Flavobacteriales bacterium]
MNTETLRGLEIRPQTIETAAPLASEIMQGTKDAMGFVPNMYGVMANNPALLDAYTHAYKTFRENTGFTSVEQEVIFLSVAYENECEYCVAAHSFVGDKMSGVPMEITDAIREGREIPDARLSALSSFARAITRTRGKVAADEIADFINAGYRENDILGVITGVGVKTFSNYLNHIANTPLDETFSPRAWSK